MTEVRTNPDIDLPPKEGQAVQVHEAKFPVTDQSESLAMLQMIERAARDPAVDVSKFKQLMDMRIELENRVAAREYDLAMTEAQMEMEPVKTDANNPQTKSKYASYYALNKVLRPIYTKHGFALSFDTAEGAPAECVRIICDVSHRGGDRRTRHIDMPADGKGAKGGDVMTKTHATGSAVSYGMRYLLKMIFNISVRDFDEDDGNAAGRDPISEEQLATLQTLITEIGGKKFKALEKGLLTYKKIKRLADLPTTQFDSAIAALEAKRGKV
jgi:hypothetical protein